RYRVGAYWGSTIRVPVPGTGTPSKMEYPCNIGRDAPQAEELDLLKLKELMLEINLNPNCADRWRWIPGSTGSFSVKSCYNFLVQFDSAENLNPSMLEAFKKLWKNDVPS
ncbi:hypothetical protein L195_g058274, partial [Trifolium pratense]